MHAAPRLVVGSNLHLSRSPRALPTWAGTFAALLFVAAVGVLGIVAARKAARTAESFDPSAGGAPLVEAIAREHLIRSAQGQWSQVDAFMCRRPARREPSSDLGPLGPPRITVEASRACVAYDTTRDGVPTTATVKLSKRGDFWCVDPRAPISCE